MSAASQIHVEMAEFAPIGDVFTLIRAQINTVGEDARVSINLSYLKELHTMG